MNPSLETSYHQSEQLFGQMFYKISKDVCVIRIIKIINIIILETINTTVSVLSKVSLTSIDFIIILFDDHVILTFHTYLNRLI